jgi:hypothetical protein
MKKIATLLLLIVAAQILNAQNVKKIIISPVKTGDGLYDLYVENPNYYPMQLYLQFNEFVNYSASCSLPYVGTIFPGKQKIMNLRRVILDIPGSFKYTNSTKVGAYPIKYDPDMLYRFPVSSGKQIKAFTFDVAKTDDPEKIMWGFSLSSKDTVRACREGVVCMITESITTNGYRSGENSITVLHPDYSFGKYEVFADSSLLVKMGDSIKSGSPLGMAGGGNYAIGAHVRFSVYYCNARIDSIIDQKITNYYHYVDPLFDIGKGKAEKLKANTIYKVK